MFNTNLNVARVCLQLSRYILFHLIYLHITNADRGKLTLAVKRKFLLWFPLRKFLLSLSFYSFSPYFSHIKEHCTLCRLQHQVCWSKSHDCGAVYYCCCSFYSLACSFPLAQCYEKTVIVQCFWWCLKKLAVEEKKLQWHCSNIHIWIRERNYFFY